MTPNVLPQRAGQIRFKWTWLLVLVVGLVVLPIARVGATDIPPVGSGSEQLGEKVLESDPILGAIQRDPHQLTNDQLHEIAQLLQKSESNKSSSPKEYEIIYDASRRSIVEQTVVLVPGRAKLWLLAYPSGYDDPKEIEAARLQLRQDLTDAKIFRYSTTLDHRISLTIADRTGKELVTVKTSQLRYGRQSSSITIIQPDGQTERLQVTIQIATQKITVLDHTIEHDGQITRDNVSQRALLARRLNVGLDWGRNAKPILKKIVGELAPTSEASVISEAFDRLPGYPVGLDKDEDDEPPQLAGLPLGLVFAMLPALLQQLFGSEITAPFSGTMIEQTIAQADRFYQYELAGKQYRLDLVTAFAEAPTLTLAERQVAAGVMVDAATAISQATNLSLVRATPKALAQLVTNTRVMAGLEQGLDRVGYCSFIANCELAETRVPFFGIDAETVLDRVADRIARQVLIHEYLHGLQQTSLTYSVLNRPLIEGLTDFLSRRIYEQQFGVLPPEALGYLDLVQVFERLDQQLLVRLNGNRAQADQFWAVLNSARDPATFLNETFPLAEPIVVNGRSYPTLASLINQIRDPLNFADGRVPPATLEQIVQGFSVLSGDLVYLGPTEFSDPNAPKPVVVGNEQQEVLLRQFEAAMVEMQAAEQDYYRPRTIFETRLIDRFSFRAERRLKRGQDAVGNLRTAAAQARQAGVAESDLQAISDRIRRETEQALKPIPLEANPYVRSLADSRVTLWGVVEVRLGDLLDKGEITVLGRPVAPLQAVRNLFTKPVATEQPLPTDVAAPATSFEPVASSSLETQLIEAVTAYNQVSDRLRATGLVPAVLINPHIVVEQNGQFAVVDSVTNEVVLIENLDPGFKITAEELGQPAVFSRKDSAERYARTLDAPRLSTPSAVEEAYNQATNRMVRALEALTNAYENTYYDGPGPTVTIGGTTIPADRYVSQAFARATFYSQPTTLTSTASASSVELRQLVAQIHIIETSLWGQEEGLTPAIPTQISRARQAELRSEYQVTLNRLLHQLPLVITRARDAGLAEEDINRLLTNEIRSDLSPVQFVLTAYVPPLVVPDGVQLASELAVGAAVTRQPVSVYDQVVTLEGQLLEAERVIRSITSRDEQVESAAMTVSEATGRLETIKAELTVRQADLTDDEALALIEARDFARRPALAVQEPKRASTTGEQPTRDLASAIQEQILAVVAPPSAPTIQPAAAVVTNQLGPVLTDADTAAIITAVTRAVKSHDREVKLDLYDGRVPFKAKLDYDADNHLTNITLRIIGDDLTINEAVFKAKVVTDTFTMPTVEIYDRWVDDSARRRGIARALTAVIQEAASAAVGQTVSARMSLEQVSVWRAAKALGFAPVDDFDNLAVHYDRVSNWLVDHPTYDPTHPDYDRANQRVTASGRRYTEFRIDGITYRLEQGSSRFGVADSLAIVDPQTEQSERVGRIAVVRPAVPSLTQTSLDTDSIAAAQPIAERLTQDEVVVEPLELAAKPVSQTFPADPIYLPNPFLTTDPALTAEAAVAQQEMATEVARGESVLWAEAKVLTRLRAEAALAQLAQPPAELAAAARVKTLVITVGRNTTEALEPLADRLLGGDYRVSLKTAPGTLDQMRPVIEAALAHGHRVQVIYANETAAVTALNYLHGVAVREAFGFTLASIDTLPSSLARAAADRAALARLINSQIGAEDTAGLQITVIDAAKPDVFDPTKTVRPLAAPLLTKPTDQLAALDRPQPTVETTLRSLDDSQLTRISSGARAELGIPDPAGSGRGAVAAADRSSRPGAGADLAPRGVSGTGATSRTAPFSDPQGPAGPAEPTKRATLVLDPTSSEFTLDEALLAGPSGSARDTLVRLTAAVRAEPTNVLLQAELKRAILDYKRICDVAVRTPHGSSLLTYLLSHAAAAARLCDTVTINEGQQILAAPASADGLVAATAAHELVPSKIPYIEEPDTTALEKHAARIKEANTVLADFFRLRDEAQTMIVRAHDPHEEGFDPYEATDTILEEAVKVKGKLDQLQSIGVINGAMNHDLGNAITILPSVALRISGTQGSLDEKLTAFENQLKLKFTIPVEDAVAEINSVSTPKTLAEILDRVTGTDTRAGSVVTIGVSGAIPDLIIEPSYQVNQAIKELVNNAVKAYAETRQSGTVTITLTQQADGSLSIMIRDAVPGGLPFEKITAKAVALGIITPEQAATLTDLEKAQLIFEPGVSTRPAGGGLGLDVHREVIKNLGGSLELAVGDATGSTFLIRLPATVLQSVAVVDPTTAAGTVIIEEQGETLAELEAYRRARLLEGRTGRQAISIAEVDLASLEAYRQAQFAERQVKELSRVRARLDYREEAVINEPADQAAVPVGEQLLDPAVYEALAAEIDAAFFQATGRQIDEPDVLTEVLAVRPMPALDQRSANPETVRITATRNQMFAAIADLSQRADRALQTMTDPIQSATVQFIAAQDFLEVTQRLEILAGVINAQNAATRAPIDEATVTFLGLPPGSEVGRYETELAMAQAKLAELKGWTVPSEQPMLVIGEAATKPIETIQETRPGQATVVFGSQQLILGERVGSVFAQNTVDGWFGAFETESGTVLPGLHLVARADGGATVLGPDNTKIVALAPSHRLAEVVSSIFEQTNQPDLYLDRVDGRFHTVLATTPSQTELAIEEPAEEPSKTVGEAILEPAVHIVHFDSLRQHLIKSLTDAAISYRNSGSLPDQTVAEPIVAYQQQVKKTLDLARAGADVIITIPEQIEAVTGSQAIAWLSQTYDNVTNSTVLTEVINDAQRTVVSQPGGTGEAAAGAFNQWLDAGREAVRARSSDLGQRAAASGGSDVSVQQTGSGSTGADRTGTGLAPGDSGVAEEAGGSGETGATGRLTPPSRICLTNASQLPRWAVWLGVSLALADDCPEEQLRQQLARQFDPVTADELIRLRRQDPAGHDQRMAELLNARQAAGQLANQFILPRPDTPTGSALIADKPTGSGPSLLETALNVAATAPRYTALPKDNVLDALLADQLRVVAEQAVSGTPIEIGSNRVTEQLAEIDRRIAELTADPSKVLVVEAAGTFAADDIYEHTQALEFLEGERARLVQSIQAILTKLTNEGYGADVIAGLSATLAVPVPSVARPLLGLADNSLVTAAPAIDAINITPLANLNPQFGGDPRPAAALTQIQLAVSEVRRVEGQISYPATPEQIGKLEGLQQQIAASLVKLEGYEKLTLMTTDSSAGMTVTPDDLRYVARQLEAKRYSVDVGARMLAVIYRQYPTGYDQTVIDQTQQELDQQANQQETIQKGLTEFLTNPACPPGVAARPHWLARILGIRTALAKTCLTDEGRAAIEQQLGLSQKLRDQLRTDPAAARPELEAKIAAVLGLPAPLVVKVDPGTDSLALANLTSSDIVILIDGASPADFGSSTPLTVPPPETAPVVVDGTPVEIKSRGIDVLEVDPIDATVTVDPPPLETPQPARPELTDVQQALLAHLEAHPDLVPAGKTALEIVTTSVITIGTGVTSRLVPPAEQVLGSSPDLKAIQQALLVSGRSHRLGYDDINGSGKFVALNARQLQAIDDFQQFVAEYHALQDIVEHGRFSDDPKERAFQLERINQLDVERLTFEQRLRELGITQMTVIVRNPDGSVGPARTATVDDLLSRHGVDLHNLVREQPPIRWGQPTTLNPRVLPVVAGNDFGQLTDLARQQEEEKRDDLLYINRGAITILDTKEYGRPTAPSNDFGQRIIDESLPVGENLLNHPDVVSLTSQRVQAIVDPATGDIVVIKTDVAAGDTNGRIIIDAVGRLGVAFDPPDLAKGTKVRLEKTESGEFQPVDRDTDLGSVTVTDTNGVAHTSHVFEATQVYNPATGRDLVYIDPATAKGIEMLAGAGDVGEKGLVIYQGGVEIGAGALTGDVTKIGKGTVDIIAGLANEELEDLTLIAFTKVVPTWVGRAVTFFVSDLGMVLIGWQVGTEIHNASDFVIEKVGGPGAIVAVAQMEDQRNREDAVLGGLYQGVTGTEAQNVLVRSLTEKGVVTDLGELATKIVSGTSAIVVLRRDGSGMVDVIDTDGNLVASAPVGTTKLPDDTQYATINEKGELIVTRRGEQTAEAPAPQTWGGWVASGAKSFIDAQMQFGAGALVKDVAGGVGSAFNWVDHTAVGGAVFDMARNVGTSVGWVAQGVGNVASTVYEGVTAAPGAAINGLADNLIAPVATFLTTGGETTRVDDSATSVHYNPQTQKPQWVQGANVAFLSDDKKTIKFFSLDANGGQAIAALSTDQLPNLPGNVSFVMLMRNRDETSANFGKLELHITTDSGNIFIYDSDHFEQKALPTGGAGGAGGRDYIKEQIALGEQAANVATLISTIFGQNAVSDALSTLTPVELARIKHQAAAVLEAEAKFNVGTYNQNIPAVLQALQAKGIDIKGFKPHVLSEQQDYEARTLKPGGYRYQKGDLSPTGTIVTEVNDRGQLIGGVNVHAVAQAQKDLQAALAASLPGKAGTTLVEPPTTLFLLADGSSTTSLPTNGIIDRIEADGSHSYIQVVGAIKTGTELNLATGGSLKFDGTQQIIGTGKAGSLIQLADGTWTNITGGIVGKVTGSDGSRWELVNGTMTLVELGDKALDDALGGRSAVAHLDQLDLSRLTAEQFGQLTTELAAYVKKLDQLRSKLGTGLTDQLLINKVAAAKQRITSLQSQLPTDDSARVASGLRWNGQTNRYEAYTPANQVTGSGTDFLQGTLIDFSKVQSFQADKIEGTNLYRVVTHKLIDGKLVRTDQSVSADVLKQSGLKLTVGEGTDEKTVETITGRTAAGFTLKEGKLIGGRLVLDYYGQTGNPGSLLATTGFQKINAAGLLATATKLNSTLANASSLDPAAAQRQAEALAQFAFQQLSSATTDKERLTILEAVGQANQAAGRSLLQQQMMEEAARQQAALAKQQTEILSSQLSLTGDGSIPTVLQVVTNPTISFDAKIGGGLAGFELTSLATQTGTFEPQAIVPPPIDTPLTFEQGAPIFTPDEIAQGEGYADAGAKAYALSAGTITAEQCARLGLENGPGGCRVPLGGSTITNPTRISGSTAGQYNGNQFCAAGPNGICRELPGLTGLVQGIRIVDQQVISQPFYVNGVRGHAVMVEGTGRIYYVQGGLTPVLATNLKLGTCDKDRSYFDILGNCVTLGGGKLVTSALELMPAITVTTSSGTEVVYRDHEGQLYRVDGSPYLPTSEEQTDTRDTGDSVTQSSNFCYGLETVYDGSVAEARPAPIGEVKAVARRFGNWFIPPVQALGVANSYLFSEPTACATLSASHAASRPGERVTLKWAVNTPSAKLYDPTGGGRDVVTSGSGRSLDVAPTQTTTYTLVGLGSANQVLARATATVYVGSGPFFVDKTAYEATEQIEFHFVNDPDDHLAAPSNNARPVMTFELVQVPTNRPLVDIRKAGQPYILNRTTFDNSKTDWDDLGQNRVENYIWDQLERSRQLYAEAGTYEATLTYRVLKIEQFVGYGPSGDIRNKNRTDCWSKIGTYICAPGIKENPNLTLNEMARRQYGFTESDSREISQEQRTMTLRFTIKPAWYTLIEPPEPILVASRTTITAGEGTMLFWGVGNATTLTTAEISPDLGPLNLSEHDRSLFVMPNETTTYTLSAQTAADAYKGQFGPDGQGLAADTKGEIYDPVTGLWYNIAGDYYASIQGNFHYEDGYIRTYQNRPGAPATARVTVVVNPAPKQPYQPTDENDGIVLQTDKMWYTVGEPVTATLTNFSAEPITIAGQNQANTVLGLTGQCGASGALTFQTREGEPIRTGSLICPAIVIRSADSTLKLYPGESQKVSVRWDQRARQEGKEELTQVPAGIYQAVWFGPVRAQSSFDDLKLGPPETRAEPLLKVSFGIGRPTRTRDAFNSENEARIRGISAWAEPSPTSCRAPIVTPSEVLVTTDACGYAYVDSAKAKITLKSLAHERHHYDVRINDTVVWPDIELGPQTPLVGPALSYRDSYQVGFNFGIGKDVVFNLDKTPTDEVTLEWDKMLEGKAVPPGSYTIEVRELGESGTGVHQRALAIITIPEPSPTTGPVTTTTTTFDQATIEPTKGDAPLTVTAQIAVHAPHPEAFSGLNWGDGSTGVAEAAGGRYTHIYTSPGRYRLASTCYGFACRSINKALATIEVTGPPPPRFPSAETNSSPLTTDKSTYQLGEPVTITFTNPEKAATEAYLGGEVGGCFNGLTIYSEGKSVLKRPEACPPAAIKPISLAPGQAVSSQWWPRKSVAIPLPPSIDAAGVPAGIELRQLQADTGRTVAPPTSSQPTVAPGLYRAVLFYQVGDTYKEVWSAAFRIGEAPAEVTPAAEYVRSGNFVSPAILVSRTETPVRLDLIDPVTPPGTYLGYFLSIDGGAFQLLPEPIVSVGGNASIDLRIVPDMAKAHYLRLAVVFQTINPHLTPTLGGFRVVSQRLGTATGEASTPLGYRLLPTTGEWPFPVNLHYPLRSLLGPGARRVIDWGDGSTPEELSLSLGETKLAPSVSASPQMASALPTRTIRGVGDQGQNLEITYPETILNDSVEPFTLTIKNVGKTDITLNTQCRQYQIWQEATLLLDRQRICPQGVPDRPLAPGATTTIAWNRLLESGGLAGAGEYRLVYLASDTPGNFLFLAFFTIADTLPMQTASPSSAPGSTPATSPTPSATPGVKTVRQGDLEISYRNPAIYGPNEKVEVTVKNVGTKVIGLSTQCRGYQIYKGATLMVDRARICPGTVELLLQPGDTRVISWNQQLVGGLVADLVGSNSQATPGNYRLIYPAGGRDGGNLIDVFFTLSATVPTPTASPEPTTPIPSPTPTVVDYGYGGLRNHAYGKPGAYTVTIREELGGEVNEFILGTVTQIEPVLGFSVPFGTYVSPAIMIGRAQQPAFLTLTGLDLPVGTSFASYLSVNGGQFVALPEPVVFPGGIQSIDLSQVRGIDHASVLRLAYAFQSLDPRVTPKLGGYQVVSVPRTSSAHAASGTYVSPAIFVKATETPAFLSLAGLDVPAGTKVTPYLSVNGGQFTALPEPIHTSDRNDIVDLTKVSEVDRATFLRLAFVLQSLDPTVTPKVGGYRLITHPYPGGIYWPFGTYLSPQINFDANQRPLRVEWIGLNRPADTSVTAYLSVDGGPFQTLPEPTLSPDGNATVDLTTLPGLEKATTLRLGLLFITRNQRVTPHLTGFRLISQPKDNDHLSVPTELPN